jgi:hypothetical protein
MESQPWLISTAAETAAMILEVPLIFLAFKLRWSEVFLPSLKALMMRGIWVINRVYSLSLFTIGFISLGLFPALARVAMKSCASVTALASLSSKE